MRYGVILCAVLFLAGEALSQGGQIAPTQPNEFEIARHTFVDIGPPSDFYELFIVRPSATGASIERILATPPANVCYAPAKVEVTRGQVNESPSSLLGSKNPCAFPEEELQRELKRCKNCLVFSGANVLLQVRCGTLIRHIRSDILDKDMFDPDPKTPEHTSSTMRLLERLDDAVGPGPMDKPMFAVPNEEKSTEKESDSVALRDLGAGKYDDLFKGAPDKPSELYRAAQIIPPAPTVRLLGSTPFSPEVFVQPKYPVLARMASIEGTVAFKADVDSNGSASNLVFENGNPILRPAISEAAKAWRFPKDAFNQQIRASIEFLLNCHSNSH